jgi:hypothetical protein
MPNIDPNSNLSFSYSKNKSRTAYHICQGWELLKRAMIKVDWSPIVYFGNYRDGDNFAFSDFMGLDFDNTQPIAEIAEIFRDSAFIIGTTRNHMREKDGVIGERFRLVVPWERRITDRDEYLASIAAYIKKYSSDTQCCDAARLFYPCREIVHSQNPDPDLELATITQPVPRPEYVPRICSVSSKRMLNNKTLRLMQSGILFPGMQRDDSIYRASLDMFSCGYDLDEVVDKMRRININRKEPNGREFDSDKPVRSAWKKFTHRRIDGTDGR